MIKEHAIHTINKQDLSASKTVLVSEEYVPRTMPHILRTWDMTTTFVVSTYLASCATTLAAAGPAAFTYLLLAALTFFVPCLIATAQLGTMFPYEGALYNWTHKALGGYWSFFSGFCAWFPGVLISASLADLLVTYVQAMHANWLTAPWQQGLVISVVLVFAGIVSIQRFRTVQNIINALVVLMLTGSLLVTFAGIIWLLTGHHAATDFSHWGNWGIRPGNYTLFGLAAFAYIGTEGPLNLAGEISGRHVIKRHLLWGAILLFATYVSNTFAVLVVQGPNPSYSPFELVTTVDKVLGKTAGSITAVCFMSSFIATVLVYNYLYARLLMVASIDRRLPMAVGKLNKHRVPSNAIIFQTTLAVISTILTFIVAPLIAQYSDQADFSAGVYNVNQAAATLVWAISAAFLFIALVGSYLRHRADFQCRLIFPMPVLWASIIIGSISCVLTIVDTLLSSWTPLIGNNQWWYIVGSLTLIFLTVAAAGSLIARSEAEWQGITREEADAQESAISLTGKLSEVHIEC
jgi:amino acid transporter